MAPSARAYHAAASGAATGVIATLCAYSLGTSRDAFVRETFGSAPPSATLRALSYPASNPGAYLEFIMRVLI